MQDHELPYVSARFALYSLSKVAPAIIGPTLPHKESENSILVYRLVESQAYYCISLSSKPNNNRNYHISFKNEKFKFFISKTPKLSMLFNLYYVNKLSIIVFGFFFGAYIKGLILAEKLCDCESFLFFCPIYFWL